MTVKKTGLGRNLNILLSNSLMVKNKLPEAGHEQLRHLPIEQLHPGKYQPRQYINEEALQELANSIRQHGIIQPIVVRALQANNYEIIAGERRWRAATLAGLSQVPVIINEVSDQTTVALALIENIQREDLNAIEEAVAYQRLIEEFNLTHAQVAEAVGKSRTAISNTLRLINLPEEVKQMVASQQLEMGHSRALLSLKPEQQSYLARVIINRKLSVRETESMVKKMQQVAIPEIAAEDNIKIKDPLIKAQQAKLSKLLDTTVRIKHLPQGRGKVVIQYNDLDKLEEILSRLQES